MRSLPLDPVRVPPMSDPAASARRPVVLLASAHEWAARSLPSILTPNGYRVLHAYAGQDALLQVRAAQPDVLMIDLQLPGIDGVALCRMLRADPSVTASTAIIATTPSPVGRQQRLEVLRAGGCELWAPPLDAEEILLRIEWYVRAKRDADAARQDSLLDLPTALYNDRGLARRTRELGAQAERARAPVTCVVLTTGTEPVEVGTAGGEVAGGIARALGGSARAPDPPRRPGPGEVAIVAAGARPPRGAGLGRRLARAVQAAVSQKRPRPVPLRIGYGTATASRAADLDPPALLAQARGG